MILWTAVALIVALYCIVRATIDVRRKQYLWAVAGYTCAAFILLTPIQTHAVKIDLPVSG